MVEAYHTGTMKVIDQDKITGAVVHGLPFLHVLLTVLFFILSGLYILGHYHKNQTLFFVRVVVVVAVLVAA